MHSPEQITALMNRLAADRNAAIDNLMTTPKFRNFDRFHATIVYDTEMSPLTTNRQMLIDIGINPDNATLDEIIEGLAVWQIFFVGTNHLTDSDLRALLLVKILEDQVHLVPPSTEMSEFIGLESSKPLDRLDDYTFDFAAVSDRDERLPRPTRSPQFKEPGATVTSSVTLLSEPPIQIID